MARLIKNGQVIANEAPTFVRFTDDEVINSPGRRHKTITIRLGSETYLELSPDEFLHLVNTTRIV